MNDTTEIIFVLDKSGSMSGLEKDTIGGFNSTIRKQRKEEGEAKVTTVLFDTRFETIHDRVDIKDVSALTDDDYCPSGCTALLDAVGSTIARFDRERRGNDDCPSKTLMIITTDGFENSSREYTYDSVKRLIESHKEKGWEFIFMGANIDAAKEAGRIGISKDRAVDFICDEEGVKTSFVTMDYAVRNVRKGITLNECSWREESDTDYQKRT